MTAHMVQGWIPNNGKKPKDIAEDSEFWVLFNDGDQVIVCEDVYYKDHLWIINESPNSIIAWKPNGKNDIT